MLDSKQYTGRAEQQVTEYLEIVVKPILERYKADLNGKSELSV
jgi:adenylosuccinate lyase